jgi:4-aminobutyrate aminotransferase-like enzyme
LEEDNLLSRASEMGAYLRRQLEGLQERHPIIESVRGQGLLVGVQLTQPGASIVTACMERGFLINCIQDNILRLAPPLIIRRSEIDGLIRCLDDVLPLVEND